MILRTLFAAALMLTASLATATPSVVGQTITWPDDGWYQVQKVIGSGFDKTFVEVCQGGRSCDVEPGEYVVINLSTQQRFDGIIVKEGGEPSSPIVVTGNTISWPDDGWYQVLDESNYSEVCGGTRSCVVPPGSYSVINHSVGVRYDGIVVEGDTEPDNPIVVTGNTISWPDDGWYQVQSSTTYETVCEGGRSCFVPSGSYSVINHATGMRWTDIIVDGPVATTSVEFDITVPAYKSNELLVGIEWGDQTIAADWFVDENWSAIGDFPTLAEHPLVVTFYDRNGAIILGRHERNYQTGSTDLDTVFVSEDQFDTTQFDDDNDGRSNLAELIAGTDPLVPEVVTGDFSLLEVSSELVDTLAGFQLDQLAAVVDDVAYIVAQTTTITWPTTDWYEVQVVENEGTYPVEFPQVFSTVCNGGAQCKILPGKHAVINHTTGERSYIEIEFLEREERPNATRLADTFLSFSDPNYQDVSVTMEQWQYQCENGGTVIVEVGSSSVVNNFGSVFGGITPYHYHFNQCDVTVRGGLLPNGNFRLDGTLEMVFVGTPEDQSRINFDGLSIVGESGLEYYAQGRVLDVDDYNGPYSRTAEIENYRKVLPGGQVSESIADVRFDHIPRGYLLSVDGVVRNELTAGQQVTIATEPELRKRADVPFEGRIEMQAEDGSVLYENANPIRDEPTNWWEYVEFVLDQDYISKSGERTQIPRARDTNYYNEKSTPCDGSRGGNIDRLNCVKGHRRGLRDITAP